MTKFSVIIPVHNDAASLDTFLTRMLQDASSDSAEIVVVCNGCTDNTVSVADSFRSQVTVLVSPSANKPQALALGDGAAVAFPRLYVDVDVRTTIGDMHAVAEVLTRGQVLAAAPRLTIDLGRASPLVKAYYAVWMQLPWVNDSLIGSGFYGLSREGHRRLGGFHTQGADDLWVSAHFATQERRAVPSATFTVPASLSIREVVRRRARILAANRRISADLRGLPGFTGGHGRLGGVPALVRHRPALFGQALLYLGVQVIARMVALRYAANGRIPWNPDRRYA